MIFEYQSPAPSGSPLVKRLWWAIFIVLLGLVIGLFLLLNPVTKLNESFGVGIAGTPAAPIGSEGSPFLVHLFNSENADYLLHATLYFVLFLLTQWLFLIRRGTWRIHLSTEGRPMKRGAIAAGFVAMLLSIGLLALLLEIPATPHGESESPFWWPNLITKHIFIIWTIMLLLWAFWAFVFYLYGRTRDRHTWMTRILQFLLAGTLLELLIAIPTHAYLARQDKCYCVRGSYTALVFGITVLLWLFGPGLFLLFLREKNRLQSRSNPSK